MKIITTETEEDKEIDPLDDMFKVQIGERVYRIHQNPFDGRLMIHKIAGGTRIEITTESANHVGIK